MNYGYDPYAFGQMRAEIMRSGAQRISQDAQRLSSNIGGAVSSSVRAAQQDEMLYNQAKELRNSYLNATQLLAKYDPEFSRAVAKTGSDAIQLVPPPDKNASTDELINYINVLTPKVNRMWCSLAYRADIPVNEISQALNISGLTEETRKIVAESVAQAYERQRGKEAAQTYSSLRHPQSQQPASSITLNPPTTTPRAQSEQPTDTGDNIHSADNITLNPPTTTPQAPTEGTESTPERPRIKSSSDIPVEMALRGFREKEYAPIYRAALDEEKARAGTERSAAITEREKMLEQGRMARAKMQESLGRARIALQGKRIEQMGIEELNKAAKQWQEVVNNMKETMSFQERIGSGVKPEDKQQLDEAQKTLDQVMRILKAKRNKMEQGGGELSVKPSKTTMTADDMKAFAHAQSNPQDPRSKAILDKLRKEGKVK